MWQWFIQLVFMFIIFTRKNVFNMLIHLSKCQSTYTNSAHELLNGIYECYCLQLCIQYIHFWSSLERVFLSFIQKFLMLKMESARVRDSQTLSMFINILRWPCFLPFHFISFHFILYCSLQLCNFTWKILKVMLFGLINKQHPNSIQFF